MQISQGKIESGIEVGNHFDKYGSKNPIVKWMMHGFTSALDDFIGKSGQTTVHEVGCGEGVLSLRLLEKNYQVKGCDFSEIAIALAQQNAMHMQRDPNLFSVKSIYELKASDVAPLVICCEVLEHLEYPRQALENLANIAQPWLILSVPREPIWSVLNMARGKYWKDFGNTPGHIQRWSSAEFMSLVSEYVDIIEVSKPLPWTMLLCKVKSKGG